MKIQNVSNLPENDFTLGRMEGKEWKGGRMEGWKGENPIFHPSILPTTKSVGRQI